MDKLLIICGPTGTGKTRLGIYLAKKFNGEIVSADSRQVYKYMNVGTGKEWDNQSAESGVFANDIAVRIHGYDLIEPTESFSVFEFLSFAEKKIKEIRKQGKLPILVGGTGLYIRAVVDGIETMNIPKNEELRGRLQSKNIDDLFENLATLDTSKAASLNNSDRKNPRRLIRAIEIAIWKIEHETKIKLQSKKPKKIDTLFFGLKMDTHTMSERIYKKVEERIDSGFIDEIENLLQIGVSWKMQSMKAIGYREAEEFFKSGLSYEEFINKWHDNEMKYIKRQLSWFKKDDRIAWFDSSDPDCYLKIENEVKKWDNIIVK